MPHVELPARGPPLIPRQLTCIHRSSISPLIKSSFRAHLRQPILRKDAHQPMPQTRSAANPVRTSRKPIRYADAGVDIASGDRAKDRIKALAASTLNRNVLAGVGGFGALFQLDRRKWKDPILVSSADGVGTKLKLAFQLGVHTTVGADLVNHCVNDIAVQGATPLFFLDYLASGRLKPTVLEQVVEGLATACRDNGCALIGGETAQMPGFYQDNEYDLAGFIVGVVERSRLVTGATLRPGDILVGLPSTGLHTNGYSLARKLFFEVAGYKPRQHVRALGGRAAEVLLTTHRSYLPALQKLTHAGMVCGMAHITGGGITENLPRILPKGTAAEVRLGSWPVLPVFEHLRTLGSVPQDEMMRTFNMGIGLIAVVPADKLRRASALLDRLGEAHYVIGEIVRGNRRVIYR